MAFNRKFFNTLSSGAAGGNREFIYTSTTDALATIYADDYFLTAHNTLTTGDLIHIYGSDGRGTFAVGTVSSTTVVLAATVGLAQVQVAITSAEVLAIRATPKTLVGAPGAAKIALFDSLFLQIDYNSAAYTETADNLAVRYTNGSGVIVSSTIEGTGFINATADTGVRGVAITDAIVANTASENAALVLHNTGDGEYGSGNSPLRANVLFSVVGGV